jgi:hypothetical protein
MDCALVIADIQNLQVSEGHFGKIGQLPSLSAYPQEVDWTGLDRVLCSRALSLRQELELARQSITLTLEVGADHEDETARAAAKIGLRAWQLASDFRRHYDLPHLV